MGYVKGKDNSTWGASYFTSSMLSLRRVDPYWRSHVLVEYSKDLGACMILDDPEGDHRYMVDDEIIYYYLKIFLTRASELEEKLLHANFLFMHFDAYHSLMEEFT